MYIYNIYIIYICLYLSLSIYIYIYVYLYLYKSSFKKLMVCSGTTILIILDCNGIMKLACSWF